MTRHDLRRQIAVVPRIVFPNYLRALLRISELAFILTAAVIGVLAGLTVAAMRSLAQFLHHLIFQINVGESLSAAQVLMPRHALLGPIAGGLVLGLLLLILAKFWKRSAIDPIEANALHGGRMSVLDSLVVVAQNIVSNGFGASVGLEAGYTQISSSIASRIGMSFELRRNDLRTLVGCGAAAAIASAFNAPLTGAFYGFELIIGTYAISSLAPVVVSALAGTIVTRLLVGNTFLVTIHHFGTITKWDYLSAFILGILAAAFGIAIMKGVTIVEAVARKAVRFAPIRPLIGGAVVGGLALVSPEVLSSGHGAMHLNLDTTVTIGTLGLLIALKSLASAVSIGSGFRGGLFFASLFLGALLGKIFAHTAQYGIASDTITSAAYAMIGMSALGVAIIGGPLTMTFLALEMSGNFSITVLVLTGIIASSFTVRKTFGYSFATWRFHLRGESVRSAHDVGWIRNLTVGRMMRRDVRTALNDISIAVFRREFPLGSTQRAIVTDHEGRYVGIVIVPEAHATSLDAEASDIPITALLRNTDDILLPQINAKDAIDAFNKSESEALAVVEDTEDRRVIGQLSESHTLRRYSEELDRRRREVSGELM